MSKSQECFDFKQNGSCKYGADCRFLHADGTTLGSRRKQEQICHAFRDTGKCEYGDDCRFAHDMSAAATTTSKPRRAPREDAPASSEANGDAPARKPRRRNRGPKENRGDDAPAAAAPKAERKERIPVPQGVEGGRLECLHWKQSKECPYGEDCRYLHDSEPTRGSRRKNELICYNFRENGECKFGDDCRYSHDASASKEALENPKAKTAPKARGPKACRDFAAGDCKYGDECRFSHEKTDQE